MNMVWLAAPVSDAMHTWLNEQEYVVWNDTDMPANAHDIIGIITSNRLTLNRERLALLPNLRWIARMGSGMEIIDTVYCAEKGIACFSSPGGLSNSVAEHAMGMLLGLMHRIELASREVASGLWIREANRGQELNGRCVGLIGYGHTGQALAEKLRAFTPHVIAYDKYKTAFENPAAESVSLQELQARADIISFHVPLNEETRYYYNDDFMRAMAKPHMVMNTSRGPVCSTKTILKGLAEKRITGACLDVLEEEAQIQTVLETEQNVVQQLLQYPVIITPHIAGYSHQATEKMSAMLMAQIEAFNARR
ncbi:MAG: NAD(P)-dependent oxidoreductase [Chitinophagaceae bacterium]